MRSIPVKESAFVGFTCVMPPEAKVVDQETGEVRKDRRSGQTVYTVGICAMRGRNSSVIQVSVVGEPSGLVLGAPVRVIELEAAPWERDGRSGVAFRAAAITPINEPLPNVQPGRRAAGASGSATAGSPAGNTSGGAARGGEAG